MKAAKVKRKGADSLDRYLTELGRIPILDADEERRLAERWRDDGDRDAAQILAASNLRFVVKVANEYRRYGLKMADLIQEGNVGLLMAIERFQPERGFRLISYAVWWIRAQIQNFILHSWRLVRLGTTQAQRKVFYGLERTRRQLRAMGADDEPPGLARVAAAMGVPEKVVAEMEQRLQNSEMSLDHKLSQPDGRKLGDMLPDDGPSQETLLAEMDLRRQFTQRIATALKQLTDREQHIVKSRALAEEPVTLQALGTELGVTRERVRQIESRAMQKLGEILGRDKQICLDWA